MAFHSTVHITLRRGYPILDLIVPVGCVVNMRTTAFVESNDEQRQWLDLGESELRNR